jgi:Cd2+/Zn2+-exporting ATPase
LLQKRSLDVHFLMLAVAIGSASIGAWGEGATLLFLFSLSGALEHYALGRTQKEIRSLFHDAPKTATVLEANGSEREVKVELLKTGMRLLVKPGSQFPVDAEVLKGTTAADESNLTGEATPVEKAVGDSVLAGTINLWGAVEVSVLRPAAESSLQKIIKLIKRRAATESAVATVHRSVQHVLHLHRAAAVGGDVFRVVAGLRVDAVRFGGTKRRARFTAQ